jgi:hypothetical protein
MQCTAPHIYGRDAACVPGECPAPTWIPRTDSQITGYIHVFLLTIVAGGPSQIAAPEGHEFGLNLGNLYLRDSQLPILNSRDG